MERKIVSNIENFLKKKFKNKAIKVSARANKPDSAEVILDDEFIGVIFEDKEDGETCYHFNMTILEVDLDEEI